MSAVFSNWKNKRHFWKVFCSSTVTFSKTIRFYLFPSLVEFFFYHYRSPCFRCFSFRVRHFSKTGDSVSILLQALKGVRNREKGKKGGGFHSIPFSPLSHFSSSPSPPLFAPATQAKILHVKAVGNSSYRTRLFLIWNHMTRRPCWGSIQHNFFLEEFTWK